LAPALNVQCDVQETGISIRVA